MINFILIAIVLVAVALVFVGLPLVRAHSGKSGGQRPAMNVAIYRDQFAELEADRARGAISEEQYAENRAELERRVLEEGAAGREEIKSGRSKAGVMTAVVLAGILPITAALLYMKWGDPDAFSPLGKAQTAQTDAHGGLSQDEMVVAVERLGERLKNDPDNLDGWLTLARSYYQMGRFDDASRAFDHIVKKVPQDADILADYADALAMAQGRNITGKPLELVKQALEANPTQWKALAMAGTDAFNRKDYKGAIEYWERLRASQPAESPIAQQLGASIDEARKLGNIAGPTAMPAMPPAMSQSAPAAPKAPARAAGALATVSGSVDVAPEIKSQAKPEDAVIIFARPADGSRMPLAITQAKVKDLPLKFTLDDSMAMSPELALSHHEKVIVGARISKSGAPMPRPGDFEGLSAPVAVGAKGVSISINRTLQ